MDLIYWLAAIFIIILIAYGVVLYLNRQQVNRIKVIDQKKHEMMTIPVADNIYTLKQLNLTGQTKQTFENWQANWQTITRFQYPEIEASLVSAEQYIQQMNFVKAKQAVENAEKIISATNKNIIDVNNALENLLESANKNRKELEKTQGRYNKIRKQLLAHSFTFGTALETLEKNLNYMELDFTKFNDLTNEGDHMEAKEVLERIVDDLDHLEEVVEMIPQLNQKIKEDIEEQIQDLEDGYERLLLENYVFEKEDIPAKIEDVKENLDEAIASITVADITEAQKALVKTEHKIDETYTVMETEMEAKEFVDRHQANLSRKMDHVIQSNRYVLLEIDRVAQNFLLNNNELGRAQEFEEQLLKENEILRYHEKMLEKNQIEFSETKRYYEKVSQRLNEIDKEQSDLVAKLSNFRNRERAAKDAVDLFEMDMRNMKRALEKQHLPGLPNAYLDLFFAVSDRIEKVSVSLNRVKLDIEEIEKMVDMCEEDIQQLEKSTENILDNANLTEHLIQYANRHRHDNPEIENAVAQTMHFYKNEFAYDKAVNTMEIALDKIEAGSARQVANNYYEEKKRGIF